MTRKRSSEAEALWRERLARFQRGDLKVGRFCRREGVSEASFYRWRKRLQQGGRRAEHGGRPDREAAAVKEAGHFVPVRVSGSAAAEIELPNGVTVRVPVAGAEALRTAILAASEVFGEVRPC